MPIGSMKTPYPLLGIVLILEISAVAEHLSTQASVIKASHFDPMHIPVLADAGAYSVFLFQHLYHHIQRSDIPPPLEPGDLPDGDGRYARTVPEPLSSVDV